jgi:hypothetical protein
MNVNEYIWPVASSTVFLVSLKFGDSGAYNQLESLRHTIRFQIYTVTLPRHCGKVGCGMDTLVHQ